MTTETIKFAGRVARIGNDFFLECPAHLWAVAMPLLKHGNSLLPRGHHIFKFPAHYGASIVGTSWELLIEDLKESLRARGLDPEKTTNEVIEMVRAATQPARP